ncbi:MAG: hypothetical protein JW928_04815 [Candidatus Aureabacteria bacterium]|nr:hypothetical protein [Candidatus Auribacterota bacterium]
MKSAKIILLFLFPLIISCQTLSDFQDVDANALVVVCQRFHWKNNRWPKDIEELKHFAESTLQTDVLSRYRDVSIVPLTQDICRIEGTYLSPKNKKIRLKMTVESKPR